MKVYGEIVLWSDDEENPLFTITGDDGSSQTFEADSALQDIIAKIRFWLLMETQ